MQATDQKQEKIKFNRTNAKDKLNSILFDDKSVISKNGPAKNPKMEGQISFENYKFNYFTGGPLVLKGLSLSISPGEKIGLGMLCRRTMNHRLWSIVYESYNMLI